MGKKLSRSDILARFRYYAKHSGNFALATRMRVK